MNLRFKNYSRLLALAHTPRGRQSVLDWRPFGKTSLGEIVEEHNRKCVALYQSLDWLPEYIAAVGEGIAVNPHDLASIDEVRLTDYKEIKFILIDLAALEPEATVIERIKARMAGHQKPYHLIQTHRGKNGATSMLRKFRPLPVLPARPEIQEQQSQLESYLELFCKFYLTALQNMPSPPLTGAGTQEEMRILRSYAAEISSIADQVRDAAMAYNLTSQQVASLTGRAAMRELALARLKEELRTPEHDRIILDPIREPVLEAVVEGELVQPVYDTVMMLKVFPKKAIYECGVEEKRALKELGIRGRRFAALHKDQADLRAKLAELGKVLQFTELSVELPSWRK